MTKEVRTVFVGLSGGVDSSVAAALLIKQGYQVVGVYMKNWSQDLPGFDCPWKEDYQDAKRVAAKLGIELKLYDFEKQYRQRVVDYMIDGYKMGLTPNPDIMCNQEIKFKLFLETALAEGADMIATGHYSRVGEPEDGSTRLLVAKNKAKDQTYFLYRIKAAALAKSLLPIGEFTSKAEVRALAEELGLPTAQKKDSQGICFVGKVGIKEFLLSQLGHQPEGDIVDQAGNVIGRHDGAIFYTIGQRHGLNVGGGLPYYVTGKDMLKNEVYVSSVLDDRRLWSQEIRLTAAHWINPLADINQLTKSEVRFRYRAPLVGVKSVSQTGNQLVVNLVEPVRAITPGQSAVFYDGDECLGGGIVSQIC